MKRQVLCEQIWSNNHGRQKSSDSKWHSLRENDKAILLTIREMWRLSKSTERTRCGRAYERYSITARQQLAGNDTEMTIKWQTPIYRHCEDLQKSTMTAWPTASLLCALDLLVSSCLTANCKTMIRFLPWGYPTSTFAKMHIVSCLSRSGRRIDPQPWLECWLYLSCNLGSLVSLSLAATVRDIYTSTHTGWVLTPEQVRLYAFRPSAFT